MRSSRINFKSSIIAVWLLICLLLSGCAGGGSAGEGATNAPPITIDDIPAYSGTAYVALNGNVPYFIEDEITTTAFESYAELDPLGRCGVAFACIGKEIMPNDDAERGEIGSVTPSGWEYKDVSNNNQYDFVEAKYIYNRCHLIGYQLAGENANKKNLITGTRYLNIEGMLPFENMIADYVKLTGNHVMYRVTPVFEKYNLVASGVILEGYSVEDSGEEISFCVYSYNVQPGVEINYFTGTNRAVGDINTDLGPTDGDQIEGPTDGNTTPDTVVYILNTKTKKIHKPTCGNLPQNGEETTKDIDTLISEGYTKCGTCKPE